MPAPGAPFTPPPAPRWLSVASSRSQLVLAIVALSLATMVAYHGIFSAPFIFDDLPGIVRNPTIRQLWPLGDVLLPDQASGTSVVGRPLVNLSLALNYASGRLDVRGYHAVNLLIHLAASVLLFAVLRRTFAQKPIRERFGAAAIPLAWCAALLWSLHPLQTESVTCVIQRTESLVGFFYLLTVYAFVRTTAAGATHAWSWLAIVACALGMATKEVMVTAPVLVLLYDRTFVAGTFREAWRQRRGLHLGLAATWLLLIFLVVHGSGRGGTVGFGLGVGPWEYLLTQCRAIELYLKLAVWPHPLVLDYGMGVVRQLADVWPQAVLLVLLAAATGFALVRRPVLGFAGAWFFITLAPSSSLVPLATQTMAEHRMYLPLAALMPVLVAGLLAAGGRRGLIAALALALFFGGVTLRRNADYRSALSIWSDTVAKAPANARARYNFANALSAAGRPADAVSEYETALRLEPGYAAAHFNLANALLQLGRVPEAVTHYEAELRAAPNSADTHANLAAALIQLGRRTEAIAHFETATRLGALTAVEQLRFGRTLAEAGRIEDALAHLREAVRLDPRDADAHAFIGLVLSAAGRGSEALRHFFEAVRLKPDDAGAQCALGDALVEADRAAEALPHYETALRLQPGQTAIIHASLGNAYAQLGRVPDAIAHYEEALRLNPGDSEIRLALARIRTGSLPRPR
ncbi:MAG: tetratricopeptide repeat protein [Opitutaceae bacterium]